MITRLSGILDVDVSTLLEINPRTNVVYLTSYPDYALDAWDTGASGFMVKPLTLDGVRAQLKKLRYPIKGGEMAPDEPGKPKFPYIFKVCNHVPHHRNSNQKMFTLINPKDC